MQKFNVADCPADSAIMEWIKREVNWKHWDADSETLKLPGVHVDPEAALRDIAQLFQRQRPVPWKSQKPGALHGLSITYDPDAPRDQWHHGSFGDSRYAHMSAEEYFNAPAMDVHKAHKGGYLDALCFRRRLPELEGLKTIEQFLDGFNFPVVRATVRVIDGMAAFPTNGSAGGMHVDSPSTEMLRLNLCVTGDHNFGLEYDNGVLMLDRPGEVLIVNTDRLHRAWIRERQPFLRAHLIVDVAPWMAYDEQKDAWSLNEYYGKVHPFDMARQGLIHKGM